MASLRIYFGAYTISSIQEIKDKIIADSNNFFQFNEKDNAVRSGFYRRSKVLNPVIEDFYVSDFFEIDTKKLPTLNTELLYFQYIENTQEKEEKHYPILVKVIFNRKKSVLCFFTKWLVKKKILSVYLVKRT